MKRPWFPTLKRAVAWVAIGSTVVVLTPFVFFPEIMGDGGPKNISPVRNYAALSVMSLGAVVAAIGTIATIRLLLAKQGQRADQSPQ